MKLIFLKSDNNNKNWSFLMEKCFKRGAFCFDHEKCEGKIRGDFPFVICESIVKTITLVLLFVQLFNCHFVLLVIFVDIKTIDRCDLRKYKTIDR